MLYAVVAWSGATTVGTPETVARVSALRTLASIIGHRSALPVLLVAVAAPPKNWHQHRQQHVLAALS